ncbi:MAG: sugar phosphate isomerase/epimerase [Bacilli bacterium]|nr:sugar phosphate isomerase/epimerase [Bacilli bacterium]
MTMQKNTYLEFGHEFDLESRLNLIKSTGFDGIFIWQYENIDKLEKVIALARAKHLNIETMHLRFEGCNNLWLENPEGETYVESILEGINLAHQYHIPTVIMHTVAKEVHPPVSDIGLKRIRMILNVCEAKNVQCAIENIRDLEYIDTVFETFSSPVLKMCFDSGHTNCFSYRLPEVDFQKYARKIVCVHLHDNLGDYDAHLVSLTGTIDFKHIMQSLNTIGFQGPLTSEAHIGEDEIVDDEAFLKKVYASLVQLEQLMGDTNE